MERTFDHPIEQVWAAYTDPALIPQWWGQGTTVDRLDLRTGGGWRFVSNPGTEKESAVSGEFLEVTPPDRLVQTFGMERPAPYPGKSSCSGGPAGGPPPPPPRFESDGRGRPRLLWPRGPGASGGRPGLGGGGGAPPRGTLPPPPGPGGPGRPPPGRPVSSPSPGGLPRLVRAPPLRWEVLVWVSSAPFSIRPPGAGPSA